MKTEETDNKNEKTGSDPQDRSNDLLCASIIMQGLLASGHYTHPMISDDEDEPEVRMWDCGEEWEENGAARRYASFAVSDAVRLLEELKERLRLYY